MWIPIQHILIASTLAHPLVIPLYGTPCITVKQSLGLILKPLRISRVLAALAIIQCELQQQGPLNVMIQSAGALS